MRIAPWLGFTWMDLRTCFENGFQVAQATRLFRPATRRTYREQRLEPMVTVFSRRARGRFGRRVADRGGRVARATHFQNRLLAEISVD